MLAGLARRSAASASLAAVLAGPAARVSSSRHFSIRIRQRVEKGALFAIASASLFGVYGEQICLV